MEGNVCCVYNLSRSCHVSPKVTVADRTDQPLTILRLLVEGLGFKAATGLWLNPLHGAPQLVRPFPFDLIYLDENGRVIEAVELLPEVPFPPFDERATSALILPVRTISSTSLQKGDELIICSNEELQNRLASTTAQQASIAVSSASAASPSGALVTAASGRSEAPMDRSPVAGRNEVPSLVEMGSSTPAPPAAAIPFLNPPAFVPTQTATAVPAAGFTAAITTTWQVASSTIALLPEREEAAVSVEREASEVRAEDAAVEVRSVAYEVAPARLESIEPGKEQEKQAASSAIPQKTAAEAMNAPHFEHPVLDTAPKAVDGPKDIQPQADILAEKERPALKARSDTRESIAPHVAPERLSRVEANKPTALTGIVQKPAAPEPRPENPPEKVARVSPSAATEEPKKKAPDKKKRKQSFGTMVKGFLNCPDPLPEYRDGARLVQQGLMAKDRTDIAPNWMEVRDVSPSGFYLRAKSQWKPGDTVLLTLQRKGATDLEYESCVDVQGKVVRRDESGIGLTWVFPNGVKFEPWERLHTKRSDESDIQYFIREIRLAKALNFLQRICPLASEEIRHAFIDRLSNKRVSSAVEIALQAEHVLEPHGRSSKVLAHSDVLMKIVESGSWIEDNWIRRMWAGLLVSSCDADGQDTSNLPFIDLLARLTPIHLRILSFVCQKYEEAAAAEASPGRLDVYCTAEELTIAADSHSFARIQQTVGQLSGFGLLVESARPSYFSVTDKEKTRTTPTAMGLKMYVRCHGRRS